MQPYEQLEHEWARFNGLDPAGMVACSSGTAALHLALEAMQLPPGSKVLVPDFTMIACPRAVTLAGLTPVFVDCDERLLVDVGLLLGEVGRHPIRECTLGAVMAVHVYGRRCDMTIIGNMCVDDKQADGFWVIEDLSEAHGVKPHYLTDAACWSFYKNKIVAGEEGGAVWFRDPKHAALARSLRSLGFTEAHDFNHVPRGHNYRMSNLHAQAILRNWDKSDSLCPAAGERMLEWGPRQRREIEGWYDKYCPNEWRMPKRDAVWVYDIKLPFQGETGHSHGLYSDYVVRELKKLGVDARCGFKPMHVQEEYRGCRFVKGNGYSRAHTVASRTVYFHVRPGVTSEDECRRAMDALGTVVGRPGRAPGYRPDNQDGGRGENTPR